MEVRLRYPFIRRGEGHTLWQEREWGGVPIPTRGHTLWYSRYIFNLCSIIQTWRGEGVKLNQRKGRWATGESTDQKAGLKISTSLNVRKR